MPLPATANNVALLANALMGQPYGYGGLCQYRDCSSMMKDIMFPFGIWLPRNSGDQSKSGNFIDMAKLNKAHKQQLILEKGLPFFTLIWGPRHISLYLGNKGGKPYIFNNLWGLTTTNPKTKQEGRAVIGKAVVMPLDLGTGQDNIVITKLDNAQGMILLDQRLINPNAELSLFKKMIKQAK